MRQPLRHISDSAAIRLVATGAYFTRLSNDLAGRRKTRNVEDYYWVIIMRAAMGLLDEDSPHSKELVAEAAQRVAAFEDAHAKGKLFHGNTKHITFLPGGGASGSSRR
jgi:hypothetical protein